MGNSSWFGPDRWESLLGNEEKMLCSVTTSSEGTTELLG